MKHIQRDLNYYGYMNGFERILENISSYCFVSDIPGEREMCFSNGIMTYENAFLVHKSVKQKLETLNISRERFLFFQQDLNLKDYFFFLNREKIPVCIGALTQKGQEALDIINEALMNDFSEAVSQGVCDSINGLDALIERKKAIENEGLNDETYINFIKNEFIVFLKDLIVQPLSIVRSTYVLNSENYELIKEFINGNISLVSSEKQQKIKSKIEERESELRKNQIFPKQRFLLTEIKDLLENCNYRQAIERIKKHGHSKIIPVLNYADNLFSNINTFNWQQEQSLLNISLVSNLRTGFENFNRVLDNEDIFFDIKRKLSKSQKYLDIKDYTKAVVALQQFMEAYLSAIGTTEGRIKNKMIQAKNSSLMSDSFHKQIIDSFDICFDETSGAKIKQLNPEYRPINHPRNDFSHQDKGINTRMFNSHLGYLIEEELGEEEFTGHFNKWCRWFQLPSINIFDKINHRVEELLKKPDLLF